MRLRAFPKITKDDRALAPGSPTFKIAQRGPSHLWLPNHAGTVLYVVCA